MANPILRNRYDQCVDVIMGQSCTAFEIFGVVDALKLQYLEKTKNGWIMPMKEKSR